jgi:hypothetical protein
MLRCFRLPAHTQRRPSSVVLGAPSLPPHTPGSTECDKGGRGEGGGDHDGGGIALWGPRAYLPRWSSGGACFLGQLAGLWAAPLQREGHTHSAAALPSGERPPSTRRV